MKTTEDKIRFAASIEQTEYFDYYPVLPETLNQALLIGEMLDRLCPYQFEASTLGDEGGIGFSFFHINQNVEYVIDIYNDLDIVLGLSLREPGTRGMDIKIDTLEKEFAKFLAMSKEDIKKWVKH